MRCIKCQEDPKSWLETVLMENVTHTVEQEILIAGRMSEHAVLQIFYSANVALLKSTPTSQQSENDTLSRGDASLQAGLTWSPS